MHERPLLDPNLARFKDYAQADLPTDRPRAIRRASESEAVIVTLVPGGWPSHLTEAAAASLVFASRLGGIEDVAVVVELDSGELAAVRIVGIDGLTCGELVESVTRQLLDPVPLALVERTLPPRDSGASAIAIGVGWAEPGAAVTLGRLDVRFDVELGSQQLRVTYVRDLFSASLAARWGRRLARLLDAILSEPSRPVQGLDWLPETEYAEVSTFGRGDQVDPAEATPAHLRFWDQAARFPAATAIVTSDGELTYEELAARAESIAGRLVAAGAEPNAIVGICVNRSPDMIASVLGVLRAGSAYLPLDPGYPVERLKLMRDSARVLVTVTTPEARASLVDANTDELLLLDRSGPTAELPAPPSADHLAYVLFTSGSTGVPKGVAMPHRALANLIAWQVACPSGLGAGIPTLQFTSLSFDVATQEILATLAAGGTLVLASESERRDPQALWSVIEKHRVERIFMPFSALQALAIAAQDRRPSHIPRCVVTAGEPLRVTPELHALFAGRDGIALENHYGPTETHVATALRLEGPVDSWPERPAIGRPIPGAELTVCDRAGRTAGVGVEGELVIGGTVVASGYLHRPDLTRERFIATDGSAAAYRTGDLVRWRADGNLEFLGRIDDQVKIRGFRVELGEVERVIGNHPDVRDVVVVAREDQPGEGRLIAYPITTVAVEDLRAYTNRLLPDYMVPSVWVRLASFPRTPTGKLDRRALPSPSAADHAREDPPTSATECAIAEVWCSLLDLPYVGRHDDFIALGGHSLLSARMISTLRLRLGRDLGLGDLLDAPTLADLARIADTAPRIEPS